MERCDRACPVPGLAGGLSEREAEVLCALAGSPEAQVGFSGLRRVLGLHPQALSRILRRLERDGLVARRAHGWGLAGPASVAEACTCAGAERGFPVAQLSLPPAFDAARAAEEFAGRWFDGLHWYGLGAHAGGPVLAWIAERGGALVRLRFAPGTATVEILPGDGGVDDAFPAAAPLVRALAEALAGPTRPRPDAPPPAESLRTPSADARPRPAAASAGPPFAA